MITANKAHAYGPGVMPIEVKPTIGAGLGFIWSLIAGMLTPVLPTAGIPIDGVTMLDASLRAIILRVVGQPAYVTTGGAFSAGVDLEIAADGRFIVAGAGAKVAKALEVSGGAGAIVLVTFR